VFVVGFGFDSEVLILLFCLLGVGCFGFGVGWV